MKVNLSIAKRILRRKNILDIASLSITQIILYPLQLFKSYFVAKYISPEIYGILKSAELIQMLNKFGSLGFKPTIIREATTFQAKGETLKVQSVKNNAYSGELILSLILFLIGMGSSVFFESNLVKVVIILSSLGLLTRKLMGILQTELRLNKQFILLSKVIFFQGLLNSIFVILTISYFKIYTVISVPVVVGLSLSVYLYLKIGKFFRLKIDKKGFMDVAKISLPLTFGTLAFGLFRYTERILIIFFLGLTAVGYFGFADTIVSLLITLLLSSVIKVRGLKIYEELGKGNYNVVRQIVFKESFILISVSFLITMIVIPTLYFFIPIYLPKWNKSLTVVTLFLFIVPVKLLSSYIAVVIKSPTVNKLFFEPIMYIIITIFLVSGTLLLNYFNRLSIETIIIIDILSYSILHISYVFYYRKSFIKPFFN